MGGIFSSFLDRLSSIFYSKEVRILILGLDNAGKTTILYRLQFDEIIETVPTIGFNVETVRYKNTTFQVWDLGGQVSIRPFWRCYFPNTNALIFVVDSVDHERLTTAEQELKLMLEEEELKDVILLILANKQDLPEALDLEQLSEALGLTSIRSHKWTIIKTSAIKGTGISEGLDWIVSALGS